MLESLPLTLTLTLSIIKGQNIIWSSASGLLIQSVYIMSVVVVCLFGISNLGSKTCDVVWRNWRAESWSLFGAWYEVTFSDWDCTRSLSQLHFVSSSPNKQFLAMTKANAADAPRPRSWRDWSNAPASSNCLKTSISNAKVQIARIPCVVTSARLP